MSNIQKSEKSELWNSAPYPGSEEVLEDPVTCPICGDVNYSEETLKIHIRDEIKEVQDYVYQMIKDAHPDWIEGNGACEKCWEYYKAL